MKSKMKVVYIPDILMEKIGNNTKKVLSSPTFKNKLRPSKLIIYNDGATICAIVQINPIKAYARSYHLDAFDSLIQSLRDKLAKKLSELDVTISVDTCDLDIYFKIKSQGFGGI